MVVVAYESEEGTSPIRIEVAEAQSADLSGVYDDDTRTFGDKVLKISRPLFDEALDLVDACAHEVTRHMDALPEADRADEVEMRFGISLDATLGASIAGVRTGAQLEVALRWTNRRGDAAAAGD